MWGSKPRLTLQQRLDGVQALGQAGSFHNGVLQADQGVGLARVPLPPRAPLELPRQPLALLDAQHDHLQPARRAHLPGTCTSTTDGRNQQQSVHRQIRTMDLSLAAYILYQGH